MTAQPISTEVLTPEHIAFRDDRKRKNKAARAKFFQKKPAHPSSGRLKAEMNRFIAKNFQPCTNVMFARISLRKSLWITINGIYCLLPLNKAIVIQISREFEKNLNKFYFGHRAVRYKRKRIKFFCFLHREPQMHLHILFEVPHGHSRGTLSQTSLFVKQAYTRNPWIEADIYCEPAVHVEDCVGYSNKLEAEVIL